MRFHDNINVNRKCTRRDLLDGYKCDNAAIEWVLGHSFYVPLPFSRRGGGGLILAQLTVHLNKQLRLDSPARLVLRIRASL